MSCSQARGLIFWSSGSKNGIATDPFTMFADAMMMSQEFQIINRFLPSLRKEMKVLLKELATKYFRYFNSACNEEY